MQFVILACCLIVSCLGFSLRDSEDPRSERTITKRNAGNYPWYVPAIFIPQVIQVHHVVYLQQPDSRCFPNFPNIPRPQTGGNKTDTPTTLEDRFGETNDTGKEPSRCVWAIVACCSPGSSRIRYTCFELLGCTGAFWDVNPCEQSVVSAAANTALKFYMANNNSSSTESNDIPVELNN